MQPILTPGLTAVLLRTQSDERLVLLASRGHERAFAAIVDRYRAPLTRMLRRLFPNAPVDDVLQVTFVGAWRAIERGAQVRDLSAWLHRIAHNAALAEVRRPGAEHAELNDDAALSESPEAVIERREDVRRALEVIADLPPRQRAALIAVAVEGRPSRETAAELGLSDTATRKLVSRARATLRTAVTAITPPPLLTWLLQAGHAAGAGEGIAGAALSAGGAVTLAKVGAAVTAVGIAASAPAAIHARAHVAPAHASATSGHTTAAAAPSRRGALHAPRATSRRTARSHRTTAAVMRPGREPARVVGMAHHAALAKSTPATTATTTTTTTATTPAPAPAAPAKTTTKSAVLWPWWLPRYTQDRPASPRYPQRPSHITTTTTPATTTPATTTPAPTTTPTTTTPAPTTTPTTTTPAPTTTTPAPTTSE